MLNLNGEMVEALEPADVGASSPSAVSDSSADGEAGSETPATAIEIAKALAGTDAATCASGSTANGNKV